MKNIYVIGIVLDPTLVMASFEAILIEALEAVRINGEPRCLSHMLAVDNSLRQLTSLR